MYAQQGGGGCDGGDTGGRDLEFIRVQQHPALSAAFEKPAVEMVQELLCGENVSLILVMSSCHIPEAGGLA